MSYTFQIGIQMQKLEPAFARGRGLTNGHQSILSFAVPKQPVTETKISPKSQLHPSAVLHESSGTSHTAVCKSNSELHDSLDDSSICHDSRKSSSDSLNSEDSHKSVGNSSLPLFDSPEPEVVKTPESAFRATTTRFVTHVTQ